MAGMYSNRSLLRSPMQAIYSDFYKIGACDALCDGLNTEVSGRLTMIRRPGNKKFCSQATTSGVDNFYSFHRSDGTIQVIADTATDVDVVTPSTITSIFTKTTGAAEAFAQGVDEFLYIADGVDTVLYAPTVSTLNPLIGKQTWNMNGVAPTVAPVLTAVPTGSIGVAWVATTMWTTMGLVVDLNGTVHQIVSVNALGNNTTQLGTTSSGEPDFSGPTGTTITETSGTPISWTNVGPVGVWKPNSIYSNINGTPSEAEPCVIYDPVSNSMYFVDDPAFAGGTSGSVKPNFTGVPGSIFYDGSVKWYCGANGATAIPTKWKPGTVYPQRSGANYVSACIVTPTTIAAANLGTPTATPIHLWEANNAGTSGSVAYTPNWATVAGNTTEDNMIIWGCLGSGTWQPNYAGYLAWNNTANVFSVVVDNNDNFQVALNVTGISGAAAPTWNTTYGATTQDGTSPGTIDFVGVTWVCVGPKTLWAASTQWYLPIGGFIPPSPSQTFGGATVQDTSIPPNNQYVTASGLSGSSAPSWGAIGANTPDGTVTWYCASKYSAASFTWTKNYGYVYCYYARTADDYYNTNPPPLQIPGTNSPNITGALGAPTGSQSGTVTDASPLSQLTSGGTNEQILITMVGSTDPQFDTLLLFRSADGFSASGPYLFCSAFPMPARNGGQPGTLTVVDFMPDLPTTLLPGLDPLEVAPVDGENAPPPGSYGSDQFQPLASAYPTQPAPGTAITGLVYYLGRLWGFIGNSVFASGGPDTNPGNGFTAWPAINEFPFDSNVVRLLPTSSCLLVFTTTDTYLLGGGPAISDFYSQLLAPGVGILSWNAVTMMLGLPYLFSSDRQFITIDPSGGFTRIGHPIGDKLSLYDPSEAYVTYHSYGDQEHALFVSNGTGEWYRCDPNPTPDSQLTGPVWSPRAVVVGEYQAIQSIETSPGVKQLLIGPATAGYILARDSTYKIFADNTSPYDAYFTMGNIVLAHPGQMAEMAFIECDFTQVGSQPSVYVLFDELGPTPAVGFENISGSFVSDPPKLYGPVATPETLWMNRYYFGQNITENTGVVGQPLGPYAQSAIEESSSATSLSLSLVPETTEMWGIFAFAAASQLANFGPGGGWTEVTYGIQDGQGIFTQMAGNVSTATAILPTLNKPVAGVLALLQTDGNTPQIVQSATTTTVVGINNGVSHMALTLPGKPTAGNGLIAVTVTSNLLYEAYEWGVWDTYGNFWYMLGWANGYSVGNTSTAIWYCPNPNPNTQSVTFTTISLGGAGALPNMAEAQFWVYEVSDLIIPSLPAAVDIVATAIAPQGPPFPPYGGFQGTGAIAVSATPSTNNAEWALFICAAGGNNSLTMSTPTGFTAVFANSTYANMVAYSNISGNAPVNVTSTLSSSTANWAAMLVLFGNQPTIKQSTLFGTTSYGGTNILYSTIAGNSILIAVYGSGFQAEPYPAPTWLRDSQNNVYQLIGSAWNPNNDNYNGYYTSQVALYAAQNIPGGTVTITPECFYYNVAGSVHPNLQVVAMEVTPFTIIPGQYAYQPAPAWCKFLQLKVDFGKLDTVQNELQAFSIFGALYQEK
jgi:hypothetical protein